MIPEFVNKWEENKYRLESYFRNHKQSNYASYRSIFEKIFQLCFNTEDEEWSLAGITKVDNGSYQGTIIFIIPKATYQPDVSDYVMTYVEYGSCSGCDTLEAICMYGYDEKPSESQIKEYMTLSLHLVQRLRRLI